MVPTNEKNISNKIYDVMKDIALCWMPYGTVFVGVCLEALNVPNRAIVMTILAGANAFLGSVVQYYKKKYDKEKMNGDN